MITVSILPRKRLGSTFAASPVSVSRLSPRRGSRSADSLPQRLRRAGLALWRGLEAQGHARALRELEYLHDRWEVSDPRLAAQLRTGTAFLMSQRELPPHSRR